jgi:hypothetical protein
MATLGPTFVTEALSDPVAAVDLANPASAPPLRLFVGGESLQPMLRRRTEPERGIVFESPPAPLDAMPLSVVEIPNDHVPGVGPPARRHHALSLRLQAADQAMRSTGVEASDCKLQFRVPSKIVQKRGNVSIDATAQVRFGCDL